MGRVVLATGIALLLLANPVQSKVVGIVFDDSGSMARSYQTALYTLQVILASLPDEDSVLLVRMSDPRVPLKIGLGGDRQQLLSSIRQWPAPKGWTPYMAVQTIMDTVQREIQPGEKGMILVITDGEFLQNPVDDQYTVNKANSASIVTAKPCTESLPCASDLRAAYLSFKQRAGEGVEAFFVTLASDPARADSLRRTVESQGVRPILLEVFNGSSSNGAFEVTNRGDIYLTFTRIASRLLESDAGDSNSAKWSADSIEFESPLPVKRLTLIRNGIRGSTPPLIADTSFGNHDFKTEQLKVGMAEPDAVSAEPLEGRVDNLVFKDPLAAHTPHRISFQGNQKERGILVLSVDATLHAQISDPNGQILDPGTDGVYTIDAGQTVRFSAWLESGGKRERVDLCKLEGVQFSIHSAFHPAQIKMEVGCEVAAHILSFNTGSNGVGTVAISVALKDYLNTRARDYILDVQELRPIDLSLRDQPGPDCSTCRADAITLPYKDVGGEEIMLQIKPVAGERMQELVYQVDGELPAGVRLVTSSGVAIVPGAQVSVPANEAISVTYTAEYTADKDTVFNLTAKAVRPWSGTAGMALTTRPSTTPLAIVYLGSSGAEPEGDTAEFTLDSLREAPYLRFELQGLRSQGVDPEHVRVKSGGRLALGVESEEGNTFRVQPGWWYCDCFTTTGAIDLVLNYTNPKTRQTATSDMHMIISAGGWVSRCWQEMCALIALILAILKLFCLLRTSRFHKSLYVAEFRVTQHGARIEQDGIRAHRWYSLLWPLCSDERRYCYGEFLFQAQPRRDRVYLVNQGGFPEGLTLDDEPLEDQKKTPLIVFRSGQILRLVSADGMILEYELRFIE